MPYSEALYWWGNVFTIIGVAIAMLIYFFWRNDYKAQQSHLYALDLLKKIKSLHLEIELLRRPKFHFPETIIKDIQKHHIPQIEDKILSKLVEIQVDLLVAETSLIKHKDLQSHFNSLIRKDIIHKINTAVHMFHFEKESREFSVQKSDLFAIIFPSEIKLVKLKIKPSILGTALEIIDDDFNVIIENNFRTIYSYLEDNLVEAAQFSRMKKILSFGCYK